MNGISIIKNERKAQIEREGFDLRHDRQHVAGQLACAGAYYALPQKMTRYHRNLDKLWPFEDEWNKKEKHSRIKQLAIAGAFIAAEIDRLLDGGRQYPESAPQQAEGGDHDLD